MYFLIKLVLSLVILWNLYIVLWEIVVLDLKVSLGLRNNRNNFKDKQLTKTKKQVLNILLMMIIFKDLLKKNCRVKMKI